MWNRSICLYRCLSAVVVVERGRVCVRTCMCDVLIMMDDTILLSTSRERMIHKLRLMKQFCDEYGMSMNASKTKFFVIHGTPEDNEEVHVDGVIIERCAQYTYLGSVFTVDGSVSSSVKAHAEAKMAQVMKFISFLKKNNDIPFQVKRRVFDACLTSSILYGCESWLNADLRPVRKLCNWSLKNLLDVRLTTCSDVCYVEAGYPPLDALVRSKQRRFFSKMWLERERMEDDPLTLAIKTSMENSYQTQPYIAELLSISTNDIENGVREMKDNISNSDSSKRTTYKQINPDLSVHSVYKSKIPINEHFRVAFTRFRVSAHSLAVEVGRWNRRGWGRLPLEERLYACGETQTEVYTLCSSAPLHNI